MRLAFCNATRRWGGVKTWSVEFAEALEGRGHRVFLYGRDPAFIERARARGLEASLVRFGFDYNPAAITRFYADFRRKGVQAVLVNVGKDLRTAGAAARLAGLPVVQRVGLPGDMNDTLSVRFDNRFLRPRYLCPCYFIRDGLLKRLPFVREGDTAVVYSAKDPSPLEPAGVNRPLRLVSTSQVNANKGHFELARTLAALVGEGFSLRWEVAGTGDRLEDLRAFTASLGLASHTRFHGFTQDVGALLDACDVFVLSSYTEGLPNTLLEAMARGLAPVARDVGGVGECWPPALAGLLVPCAGWERTRDWSAAPPGGDRPESALPLYGALKSVLSAPEARVLRWKREARRHLEERFSLPVQAARLEAFFADLLE